MNEQELNAKIADVEKTLNELKQELIKSQKPKVVPKPGDIVVSNSNYENQTIHFIPTNIDKGTPLPTIGRYGNRLGWNGVKDKNNPVDNNFYKDHKVLNSDQVAKLYKIIVDMVKDQ